jgi:acetyl-CoA carboxylase biotin carboxyl carrier protein
LSRPSDISDDPSEAGEAAGQPRAAIEYWRGLAEIAREEALAELEIEQDGVRVTLLASSALEATNTTVAMPGALPNTAAFGAPQAQTTMTATAGTASTPAPGSASEENVTPIVSPMVGMFYRAPSPSDPDFVEVGDKVEVGQTVALIEAMKVFNEITAEVAGIVAGIKAENGDLVETGQVLLTIRP